MEIIIGATPRIGVPIKKMDTNINFIEARVLNVRPPRRRRQPATGTGSVHEKRRNCQSAHDPAAGRVMMLLVPAGEQLPSDITSGNYRVFLRFAPLTR